jgi:hypothetical protein
MARDFAGPVKNVIQIFCTILVPLNEGLMSDAQLVASLGCPVLISKKDNFGVWMNERPTFERITLNDSTMAIKGLRSREKG